MCSYITICRYCLYEQVSACICRYLWISTMTMPTHIDIYLHIVTYLHIAYRYCMSLCVGIILRYLQIWHPLFGIPTHTYRQVHWCPCPPEDEECFDAPDAASMEEAISKFVEGLASQERSGFDDIHRLLQGLPVPVTKAIRLMTHAEAIEAQFLPKRNEWWEDIQEAGRSRQSKQGACCWEPSASQGRQSLVQSKGGVWH
jgi:hypothetical protein